jgi:hypothetical protein
VSHDRVGETWFKEAGYDGNDVGKVAAQAALRDLKA